MTTATIADIITVEQAQKLARSHGMKLGINGAYMLAHTGQLPGCFKVGQRFFVRRAIFEAFLVGEAVTA